MRSTGRLDTARLSEGERTWRLLVERVMETRGEWRRKVVEATGLPFSRVRALWRLEHGPRTLAELAQQMGADAPATTVLVDATADAMPACARGMPDTAANVTGALTMPNPTPNTA